MLILFKEFMFFNISQQLNYLDVCRSFIFYKLQNLLRISTNPVHVYFKHYKGFVKTVGFLKRIALYQNVIGKLVVNSLVHKTNPVTQVTIFDSFSYPRVSCRQKNSLNNILIKWLLFTPGSAYRSGLS